MRQAGTEYFNIAPVPVNRKQAAKNINKSKGPDDVRAFGNGFCGVCA
jgi:hypothetical protein